MAEREQLKSNNLFLKAKDLIFLQILKFKKNLNIRKPKIYE
jgi:hypothetical protein